VGHQLAALARQAWLSRRLDDLENVCQAILDLPLDPKTQKIALLYRAHRFKGTSQPELYRAAVLGAMDGITPGYQARALLWLADSYYVGGNLYESWASCLEAGRVARCEEDYVIQFMALRHLAVIRSSHGDHNGALKSLEALHPLAPYIAGTQPGEYYEYLNSLAVELGEVGRIEAANRAVDLALRSPFAPGYPHWQETKLELAAKQPKVFTPLVFALGTLHQAQKAIQPTRESLQAAPLAAPEVKTSENPAVATQAQPARARKVIRRIPIIFQQTIQGRTCEPSFARALRLYNSQLALSPKMLGYSISPPSRAPPTTTC